MQLHDAGVIWTHPKTCGPLDDVTVLFEWKGLAGQNVRFEVIDAAHRPYLTAEVPSGAGKAELTIKPGSAPGVHLIKAVVCSKDGPGYHRWGSIRVEPKTRIRSDTGEMDALLEQLEEGLRQALDVANIDGKPVTYYKAADNSCENFAYPPFAIPALRYFIRDVKTMFEAIYGQQWPSGRLPDHIYTDGNPNWNGRRRIRTVMADLEICTASMLVRAWQAHGDDEWARGLLPKVEASMEFATSDPSIYDEEHGLIKRAHTLDEWDIPFPDRADCYMDQTTRFVLMQGDTSGAFEACDLLARLYAALGRDDRAAYWRNRQSHYHRVGNRLFWDGVKYRHHIHLDAFDHGDFDEDDQLAMSNSWAITRGFADHSRAVAIINEYLRRWEETGDRFPWWSLQPGYPDSLGYFNTSGAWSKAQGEYANGGLFPWVGAELCKGAFQHGMEEVAYRLLQDFRSVVNRYDGAVFTWYDLEGNAAVSAPHHQTNYDPWGISPWTQVVIEELAGIKPQGRTLEHVLCCPRWPVTETKSVKATAHFPASDAYFAYDYDLARDRIRLRFTGTGKTVAFRILLPNWPQCRQVTIDGKRVRSRKSAVEKSVYVDVDAHITGVHELVLER